MPKKKWTLGELLRVSSEYLKKKSIESPRLTAEILLAKQLATDRISLYLNFEGGISEADLDGYRGLIARRASGEPIQYITGRKEFWSLEFKVDRRVLIPRPETEVLVEQALSEARKRRSTGPLKVLEIGTGSGAVAVAVAKELPAGMVTATDISGEALDLARENALIHNAHIRFLKGDLFAALPSEDLAFDIILSNPPYVAREEWDSLPVEVRCHEPRWALDGGRGGTEVIERILRGAHRFLAPGGALFIEMAPQQTVKMLELAQGLYDDAAIVMDYSGKPRVLRAGKGLQAQARPPEEVP